MAKSAIFLIQGMHNTSMVSYYLLTYGCTLNHADSDRIIHMLDSLGHARIKDVSRPKAVSGADVIVFNTCGVKGATHNRVLLRLSQFRAMGKPVVLTGCMYPCGAAVRNANSNVVIVGTSCPDKIPEAIQDAIEGRAVEYISQGSKEAPIPGIDGVIARIPICEGCLGSCSYCFTKIARGELKSFPVKDLRRSVEHAAAEGAREIQITAQDTGAYGKDINTNIIGLLQEIVAVPGNRVPGNYRIRLGMINPQHVTEYLDGLIEIYKSPRMYKFMHIPVQSGSDDVLKYMERKYDVETIRKIVPALRSKIPGLIVATDMIVGYPTETEEDFQNSMGLLRQLRFDIVNVSKYSSRPFTLSNKMHKPLPVETVNGRSVEMSGLCREISLENNKAFLGKELAVTITEIDKIKKDFKGRAGSYKQVVLKSMGEREDKRDKDLKLGDEVTVRIVGAASSGLIGEKI